MSICNHVSYRSVNQWSSAGGSIYDLLCALGWSLIISLLRFRSAIAYLLKVQSIFISLRRSKCNILCLGRSEIMSLLGGSIVLLGVRLNSSLWSMSICDHLCTWSLICDHLSAEVFTCFHLSNGVDVRSSFCSASICSHLSDWTPSAIICVFGNRSEIIFLLEINLRSCLCWGIDLLSFLCICFHTSTGVDLWSSFC